MTDIRVSNFYKSREEVRNRYRSNVDSSRSQASLPLSSLNMLPSSSQAKLNDPDWSTSECRVKPVSITDSTHSPIIRPIKYMAPNHNLHTDAKTSPSSVKYGNQGSSHLTELQHSMPQYNERSESDISDDYKGVSSGVSPTSMEFSNREFTMKDFKAFRSSTDA